jgi:hypothetical protein
MIEWLHAPCVALNGRAPREVIREDPDAVLAAAQGSARDMPGAAAA